MALFNLFGGETRSIENPTVSLAHFDSDFYKPTGATVTEAAALGVPAIFQAVTLIAGTLAHLPLHLYRDSGGVKEKAVSDPLYRIIHDQPNDVHTSFAFRNWLGSRLLLDGRAIVLIVRNRAGKVAGLLPLALSKVEVRQDVRDGRLVRSYTYDRKTIYHASEILDFVRMPKSDGIGHYSPIELSRSAIASIIAAESYASALFEGGGVPPLKLTGAFASPATQDKAQEQIAAALRSAKSRNRNIVAMPSGFDLQAIGIDPVKQQLLELRQFQIAEVSRIFNVPPALLFDLTHGTYSNVEQQNLAFAQHTMTPLCELIEQELNSKLFGARNTVNSIEFNLDGLQRGAFKDRMDGLARAVNSSLITPNEARALDNRPAKEGGDDLLIQGATVKLSAVGTVKSDPDDQSNDPAE